MSLLLHDVLRWRVTLYSFFCHCCRKTIYSVNGNKTDDSKKLKGRTGELITHFIRIKQCRSYEYKKIYRVRYDRNWMNQVNNNNEQQIIKTNPLLFMNLYMIFIVNWNLVLYWNYFNEKSYSWDVGTYIWLY